VGDHGARLGPRLGPARAQAADPDGLAGYAVSMASFGAVVFAGVNGWLGATAIFIGLMLARALFGLTGSASNPAAQAYVAERTTPEQRTNAISVLASAFGLGTGAGPRDRSLSGAGAGGADRSGVRL
jgi:MFS family permease